MDVWKTQQLQLARRRYRAFDENTMGTHVVAPAVPGKAYLVLGILLVANESVGVTIKSGDTNITGKMSLDAQGGFSAHSQLGLARTRRGEALGIALDAAQQVGGTIIYTVV